MRVLVAVFVLALVALLWALLAIVHHVRRSRRRNRRLRETETFPTDSISLGLSHSRIALEPDAPELSFRDPESPAADAAPETASTETEPQATSRSAAVTAAQPSQDTPQPQPPDTLFAEARPLQAEASVQHDTTPASWAEPHLAAAAIEAAPAEVEQAPAAEAVAEADEEGEWETSLLRTLSGGDRALLARAKMSEASEETAMPDFVMPSRVVAADAPAPARGRATSTLFGEPFSFESFRPLQSIARAAGFPAAARPKTTVDASASAAPEHRTWSPKPVQGLAEGAATAGSPAAAASAAPGKRPAAYPAPASFAPPVLAISRAPAADAHPTSAIEVPVEPIRDELPTAIAPPAVSTSVPVLARVPITPQAEVEAAPTLGTERDSRLSELLETSEIPEVSGIQEVPARLSTPVVPVLARFVAPPAATPATVAAVAAPAAEDSIVPAAAAYPPVLSRPFGAPEPPSAAAKIPEEFLADELPTFVPTHAGIALPPAPLAHPAAALDRHSAENTEATEPDDAAEPVIAPTFPISQPTDFQIEAARAVPFRVHRPAPPLVRPQPQTIPGAIVALRDAGMDSGISRITRSPRLISPSQSMPPGPAFHRVAPRLASNSSGRHLVAPLRRPDLSSYYSKDLGDLSDPVAPRGRNREPRAPQPDPEDQKRQA